MPKATRKPAASNKPPKGWWLGAGVALVIAVVVVAMINSGGEPVAPGSDTNRPSAGLDSYNARKQASNITGAPSSTPGGLTNDPISAMEAAQSVVVTHDLDFGAARPTLAEAVAQIDRRSQPEDGVGRTFAILEAFNGEFQSDGRMRVSLRISTEKPGMAEVVFRPTTNVLWKSRIKPATHKPGFAAGQLTILFDNGDGKTFTVDGSTGPASIFDAMLKEPGLPVAEVWPDGAERELSFIYSSCGCPIKVACRRVGLRSERTKAASQVIFPDDPAAMQVITGLMRW